MKYKIKFELSSFYLLFLSCFIVWFVLRGIAMDLGTPKRLFLFVVRVSEQFDA